MLPENEKHLVVIARYIDVRQAEFALSVLEGNDMEGFIDVPYTSSMFPHYMLGSGGVALYVAESDADRALEVLSQVPIEPDDIERDTGG